KLARKAKRERFFRESWWDCISFGGDFGGKARSHFHHRGRTNRTVVGQLLQFAASFGACSAEGALLQNGNKVADVLPFDHSIREGGDVGSASNMFNFVVPIQFTRQRKLV